MSGIRKEARRHARVEPSALGFKGPPERTFEPFDRHSRPVANDDFGSPRTDALCESRCDERRKRKMNEKRPVV